MPLPDIQLDDRTFEQLQAELRRRIPAYTPEWTDNNETDPGITLMQLFAYLAEMIIYRLNKVPQKNYQAFLQLVGVNLTPPKPAKAELTFTLSAAGISVPIPAGTQVQLASGAAGPVVFETDEDILAVGLNVRSVQVYDGARYTVIPVDNLKPGKAFAPLSNQPQPGAALYLGFDQPFPRGQNRLTIHAAPPPTGPIVQAGPDLLGASLPPVLGYWEYYAGDSGWLPLTVSSDGTNCLTQSGVVKFDAPGNQATKLLGGQRPSDQALYWIRYRLAQLLGSGYETQPLLEDVLLNTVLATNAVRQTDELLGASNGLPDQTFTLANVPILPGDDVVPLIVSVYENAESGFQPWTQVDDFAGSGPVDKVFTINLSTGVVTFGNGIHGKIPAFYSPNQSNDVSSFIPNVQATSYRWGGGAAGNAGPDTITTLNSIIAYVDAVTNHRAATGGADEETVEEAGNRAPAVLRTQYRAVTAQDFADIAMRTPGAQIVRAVALPLHHPTLSVTRAPGVSGVPGAGPTDVPFPGVITVVVIPYSTDPKPVPSAATLQAVASQLDANRLVTTEVYVKGPDYRKVEIQVQVIANPRFLIATVSQALNARLLAYFHPVTGGENGTGWDFGNGIYAYETLRQILLSTGVVRIVPNTMQTYVDDVLQTDDLLLGPSETVYSIKHTITVTYS